MMIREVEHVELKVRRLKQAYYWKQHIFFDYDVIKLDRVVDPIKIHILCENQEFLQTL